MSGPGLFLPASIVPGWDPFVNLIKGGLNFLADSTGSAGLAIILFTIIVKLVLTPLTVKSLKSSRAMQDLQPKIKALQKKYGNDRQKVSAETMLLYQQHRVNPMAGCLPVLLQIPVFIGLYQSIDQLSREGAGKFAESFLWLDSLAAPDHLHILPFVAAGFQLIQARMSMPTGKNRPTDPQQQMMLQMLQFMPLTVIIFGWSFASGPVIYWATQSVFSAVQQYWITGWGALRDWLPFLPEVVRYTPKTEEELDAIAESKVVVAGSGDDATPAAGGLWGLVNRQMQKVEQQRIAAQSDPARDTTTVVDGGRAKEQRSRIIYTNSNGGDEAGAGATGDADRRGGRAEGAGNGSRRAGSPGSSRIIVTESATNPNRTRRNGEGGANGNGAADTTGDAKAEERQPGVPRKGRNRR